MESSVRLKKCVISVRMSKYLVEYLTAKYGVHPKTGGVRFPPGTDLYVLVWDAMRPARISPREESEEVADSDSDGELKIHLPCSGMVSLTSKKSPEYWNYLSLSAKREIRAFVSLHFNFEFHRFMMKNEELGRPRQIREAVADFRRKYRIMSISEDGLLKNFARYRQKISPSKKRKYTHKR